MDPEIPRFSDARVLVVGDAMLDRYWYGQTARISPEAPVPIVHVGEVEERAGGAGNVAVNLAALGAHVQLVAAIADDPAGSVLEDALLASGVAPKLVCAAGWRTVTKLRVISRNQQLIRLDFETPLPAGAAAEVERTAIAALDDISVLVISDYGKGAIGDCAALIQAAHAHNIPVLVDPKGRDWERYIGASALTPNRGEFEIVVGACANDEQLSARADELRRALSLEALLVTRSEEGMSLYSSEAPLNLAAEAREVFDVTGAGDTVIATLAAGIGAGLSMADAARVANIAAGIVVGKLGAASVTPSELALALHAGRQGGSGVSDQTTLLRRVAAARAAGERIVMTNGCFDILHPGHVAYLEDARRLGDRLIVAVNDDASVTRLKGMGRPVNPLEHRLAVLAGLASVDWVVPFGEDTPAALVEMVKPDILVKGGDYQPEEVAGGEHAGEVRILPFRDGCSTSRIIAAIRGQSQVD